MVILSVNIFDLLFIVSALVGAKILKILKMYLERIWTKKVASSTYL